MKIFSQLVLVLFISTRCFSQATSEHFDYPAVGKPCPDFTFTKIFHWRKPTASIKDFRGKWLVLDFWSDGCSACIASFPNVNRMQQRLKDKAEFIMVGIENKNNGMEKLFRRYSETERLSVACAFDSLLAKRWDIDLLPHIFIIDPNGIVRGIGSSITEADYRDFFAGKGPVLYNDFLYDWDPKPDTVSADKEKPMLINGNGGYDSIFIARSIIGPFNRTKQVAYFPEDFEKGTINNRFQALGLSLRSLYNYAYFGYPNPDEKEFHTMPILEIKDSSLFWNSSVSGRNQFCYSVSLPPGKATSQNLQLRMQHDLEDYFGFRAEIQSRKFTIWHMTATKTAKEKLKAKKNNESFEWHTKDQGFSAKNYPFKDIFRTICFWSKQEIMFEAPANKQLYLQSTDIDINCSLTDIEQVKKAIQPYGLILTPETKEQRVLVIKDK